MRSAIRSLLLAASLLASGLVWAQPTVMLVRHGEKLDSSRDSVLSPAGEARALRLAQMLAASGIRAIYTTEYRRTILLAAPLAKQLVVTPVAVPGADQDALLKRIGSHKSNETVLVVGHSNTVPAILKALGHTEEVKIDESEFDNLFVLVPKEGKAPAVVRLKY
ncbi:MAG: histidine phosphatase family protein [Betaproteobacteria bacterium]|nr:histidine phosphatase family protein [Betaproteobacteria bacterium]